VGRPLWREDGSVFCMCCGPLPAESFSGPSLLGFGTIFYCLRFETSLFVASYDSQGHGGGIRPRLHTGWIELPQLSSFFTPWHGPHRKHNRFHSNYCYVRLVSAGTCLSSRCSNSHLFIHLLHSNGCTRCLFRGPCLATGLCATI
jgi:hypothetical protein